MYGYEYGNARLRAMRARLLSGTEMEMLARSGTLENLLTALAHTAYEPAVQAALVRASDLDAISFALSQDQQNTVSRIRGFFSGTEGDSVSLVLLRYDVHNLKVILRGLVHGASPPEMRAALLLMGDLSEATLQLLTQMADLRAGLDLLASMRLPQAAVLLEARTRAPEGDVAVLELALDRWYFEDMAARTSALRGDPNWLARDLALQADTANLLTVLRLVHAPLERGLLPEQMGVESLRGLLVGPGRLSLDLLGRMAEQPALEEAVALAAGLPFYEALRAGYADYEQNGRLSAFEHHLRRHALRWRAGLGAVDPLGIGMLLSYLALKQNEIANLQWIAHAIEAGVDAEAIGPELELMP